MKSDDIARKLNDIKEEGDEIRRHTATLRESSARFIESRLDEINKHLSPLLQAFERREPDKPGICPMCGSVGYVVVCTECGGTGKQGA